MDGQTPHAGAIGAGIIFVFVLFFLALLAFWVFLYWRIFTKAGLAGALSLIIFFPFFGYLIVLCILAFSEWKVVPASLAYGLQPYPPPPPSYPPPPPPPSYPPPGPPAL
jgi:uncharacterized membrane protein YhaH (DUF805 family)